MPVASANLPVLLAGSTVTGTVVVTAYRQVLADFRPAVLVPALSRVTARLPAGVPNVYDAPFPSRRETVAPHPTGWQARWARLDMNPSHLTDAPPA